MNGQSTKRTSDNEYQLEWTLGCGGNELCSDRCSSIILGFGEPQLFFDNIGILSQILDSSARAFLLERLVVQGTCEARRIPKRLTLSHLTIAFVLQRRGCSGFVLEALIGHTVFALVCRPFRISIV